MCISRAQSTWGIQLSKDIQFEASATQNRGNSKLLGRITVIVFNVPSPYYLPFFKFFQRSLESRHWQVTTQFIKFDPVPIYLELSFILFA